MRYIQAVFLGLAVGWQSKLQLASPHPRVLYHPSTSEPAFCLLASAMTRRNSFLGRCTHILQIAFAQSAPRGVDVEGEGRGRGEAHVESLESCLLVPHLHERVEVQHASFGSGRDDHICCKGQSCSMSCRRGWRKLTARPSVGTCTRELRVGAGRKPRKGDDTE